MKVAIQQQEEILLKQQETREAILNLAEKIPSKRILYFFGGLFQKGEPKENFIFWLSNYIFLTLVILGPAILLSIAINELSIWRRIGLIWLLGTETPVFLTLSSYIVTKHILKDIAGPIIGKINNRNDLSVLRDRLTHSFTPKSILPYSVFAWFSWVIAIILGMSFLIQKFVGWGPSLATIPAGLLIGISFHYLVWSSQIPVHLSDLEYELNHFMPANSELVSKLTNLLNKYLYILAIAFAIITFEVTLFKEMIVLSFFPLIGWITITMQFLINRSTIKKIIDSAKWKTLNQIQDQMNEMQMSGNLAEKEIADSLGRLSDIYLRVFANNVSALDFRTVLNFFSQMMLPLLGLLLANLDRVIALLR